MDLPALFTLFDSVFTEKRFRTQRYKDVVNFAKISDASCRFEGGYLFTGSRHMHRPLIFMGVYVCNSQAILHLNCQCKLRIPSSLQPSTFEFLNSLNASSKGLWTISADSTTRFSSAHVLPSMADPNLKSLVCQLIQRTDTWFKETIGKFVEWMKNDPGFGKSVRLYQEEFAYFSRVMPKDVVQDVSYKDMSDLAQHQLKALGFSKYALNEKYGKTEITFTLTNEGTSTGLSWKMFPVILMIGPALLEIKIVFMMNEQWVQFKDQAQIDMICGIIAYVNSKISFGYFTYDSEKKYVYLYAKSPYCLMDKKDFGVNLERALAVCISNYKTYAYGFVEMKNNLPVEEIYQKCVAREQYFKQREIARKRRQEDEKNQKEEEEDEEEEDEEESDSNDVATDEYSDNSSVDSEREEEKAEMPVQTGPVPGFQQNIVDFLRRELPSALQRMFCLSPQLFTEWKLVHWKYDDRLGHQTCISNVIEGFIKLRRSGIEFNPLPFDSGTLNSNGELILLPTFPLDSIKIYPQSSERCAEEEKLRFDFQSAMLPYLSQNIAREHHLTLASFKVFRPMQDVDFIPPHNFKVSNLVERNAIIGNGGFGTIYRNEWEGREVALKTIKQERAAKRPSRDYLKTEFKLMQACIHKNVVRVYGYTKYEDQLMLVMEFCSNGGLSKYLHTNPGLPFKKRVQILMEVANGMTLVHAKSICHFDLKPQNVLLTDDLTPKICDFGLSQVWTPTRPCKKVGLTMMYAAPEQVAKKSPNFPADVWAFGILIYYTLVGKHPFEYIRERFGKTDEDRKRLYEEISGRRRKPLFERDFERDNPKFVHLIRACLSFEPDQRPVFRDLVKTIQDIYNSLP